MLLYLQQEGRGIGLVNKLRAYELQDQGFDTLDANERLGFAQDERDFRLAAAMLRALGVGAVRLLTNNPAKVAALEAAGVARRRARAPRGRRGHGQRRLSRHQARARGASFLTGWRARPSAVRQRARRLPMPDDPGNSALHFTDREALLFHSEGRPGKIEIVASKPMATQRDLALAYSPGVAVPVQAIADDPDAAYDYTAKGNLVAVISNGTAILGLGNLGALASKPVMEGKAVLFKRFADVDSIDIELEDRGRRSLHRCGRADGAELRRRSTSRTSRRPNASSSKADLRARMNIPVFHDDQHGTAIITAAGLINACA